MSELEVWLACFAFVNEQQSHGVRPLYTSSSHQTRHPFLNSFPSSSSLPRLSALPFVHTLIIPFNSLFPPLHRHPSDC